MKKKPFSQIRQILIKTAMGEIKPDLILRGGKIINVFTGKINAGDILIKDGYIAAIGDYSEIYPSSENFEIVNLDGKYVSAGFINAHVHVESSMVLPNTYAREEVRFGTTTIITDPHEIGNVGGGGKKVTAVHKANIMKLTDGMFLSTFREVAKDYPAIEADDCIIDALCMKLVQKPEQFDVLVAPNLYGDIISDLCAGLVGGLGFAPSANIGAKTRIYEAVHGSAPDIAGQNKANPSAILMAFAMMLNDLGMTDKAARLNAAILAQVAEGKAVTADIGGTATTTEFTDAVAARL